MSIPGLAAVGPLFTAVDMLIRYSAAYEGVEPSIDRLQKRLENLSYLLRSIHELKPKHLALKDLFRCANKYVTEDLIIEFNSFLREYGRTPKLYKQKSLRKIASATDKAKKFVLSTNHEAIIRRLDEAVSKVVTEVNTLLQVEEMYNLNNMSDSMRAVLANLKDIPHANAQLVREMEIRVLGNLKSMQNQLKSTNKTIQVMDNKVSMMAKDLAAIYQRLDALPKYLQFITSTEIRDLWRHREWSDCIPFGHFARALDEFIDYSFVGISRPVQRRLVTRICSELKTHVLDHHGNNEYLAPSDLDRLIPPQSQLIDYAIGIELGWLVYVNHLSNRLGRLADSFEAHPAKTRRLVGNINISFDPLLAIFQIDPQYIPDVIVNIERNSAFYYNHWSMATRTIVTTIDDINILLSGFMDDGQGHGKNTSSTDTFTLSRNKTLKRENKDVELFSTAHQALSSHISTIYQELEVNQSVLKKENLLLAADTDDISKDELSNRQLIIQYEGIQRNLAKCLGISIGNATTTDLARIYIKIAMINRLEPIQIPGLCDTYTGIYQSIPVLVHLTSIPCVDDLPDDYIQLIRHTRHPHPTILHILGLGVYTGQWAVVHELANVSSNQCNSITTLAQYLWETPDITIGKKIQIAKDLVSAVDYLHTAGITHGSLCPTSVLIDMKLNVNVIPGLQSGGWISPDNQISVYRYSAPEKLTGFANVGPSNELADIWSLGATIMTLITGRPFLHNIHDTEVISTIKSGSFEFSSNNIVLPVGDGSLGPAIIQMVNPNCLPTGRTTIEELDAILDNIINSGIIDVNATTTRPSDNNSSLDRSPTHNHRPSSVNRIASSRLSSHSGISSFPIPSECSLPLYEQVVSQTGWGTENNEIHSPIDVLNQAISVYNGGKGNITKAIPLFETAYTTYQQYEALYYLGEIYYFGNPVARIKPDYTRAYEYYLKATHNGSRSGHIGLGDVYLFQNGLPEVLTKSERLQQARHHYEIAYRDNPNPNARLLCGLADLEYYSQQSDSRLMYHIVKLSDDSLRKYQQANTLEPGYYRAQIGIADCLLARGQTELAKEIYLMVAEALPSLRRVYIGLSLTAIDHDDRDSYGVMSDAPGVHDH